MIETTRPQTTTPEASAPARTTDQIPTYAEQMAFDKKHAISSARSLGKHLIAAADAGDLEALAHEAYLTICALALDFSALGTITALTRWRRVDRKRIDRIFSLADSLRRDRPYPYNPPAVVAAAKEDDHKNWPPFFDRAPSTWSWHDKEHYALFLVGLLEEPTIVEHLEGLAEDLKQSGAGLYTWMLASARWLQDPRPIAEKGGVPPRHVDDDDDEVPVSPVQPEARIQQEMTTEPTDMAMLIDIGADHNDAPAVAQDQKDARE